MVGITSNVQFSTKLLYQSQHFRWTPIKTNLGMATFLQQRSQECHYQMQWFVYSWTRLYFFGNNKRCLINIVNIVNVCINIGYWPSHFKMSSFIIISKPNKVTYNFLKVFYFIILLNTLGKLIEKVIGKRFWFQSIPNNFIHPNQLRGLKQHSTMDKNVFLTHFIHSG